MLLGLHSWGELVLGCGAPIETHCGSKGREMYPEKASPTKPQLCSRPDLTADLPNIRTVRWYVVQTQPHAEIRAVSNLERQGYHVFCPRIRKTIRHARTLKHVLAPLFPGYIFVRLDVSCDPWRSVNGTFGVSRLIAWGETPQPLPHGIVEALQAPVHGHPVVDWSLNFQVGQAVRVADGPFTNLVGTLEQLEASGRVRVLLDLLGRSVSVALRCEALAATA
jgi:transcription elongation factor/antiterminator RfaH